MKLEKIQLTSFRNIGNTTLALHPGLNVFRGKNGQGKTNLVEAIHLLTHGKSFRTIDNSAFLPFNDFQQMRILGFVEQRDLNHLIEVQVQGKRKKMACNGKTVTAPALKKRFPSVLFSPESLMVVKESPQQRRDLIDDLGFSVLPGFVKAFEDWRKLLRQRNALLKQIKEGSIDSLKGLKLLESLTELFFEKSSQLVGLRLKLIEDATPLLQEELNAILKAPISMDYLISGQSALSFSSKEILNALYKRWQELRENECRLGQSLVGPHKHDIKFIFAGQEARYFCSQGQQRAIILAFKMAHIRLHYAAHGVYPILLLDDVLSELDREKQDRFVDYLLQTRSQIFLTTTDAAQVPEVAEKVVFKVEDGHFIESERLKRMEVPSV